MKLIIALAWLIIFPFSAIAQQVILESEPVTDEQRRVYKIEAQIEKLKKDYLKSLEQYNIVYHKLSPNNVVLNPTKAKLEKKLQDIEAVQYEMQRQGLKEKCNEINSLTKTIGLNDYSCSIGAMEKRLDQSHRDIRNQLAALQKKQGEKASEMAEHKNNISNLDKELSSLDKMLSQSKVSAPKKSISLDDFLSGREEAQVINGNDKAANSLDAMIENASNKSTGKSLDSKLGTTTNKADFKIDRKDGLTGVITSHGKILIPYRDWEIVEYKAGIAKVKKKAETTSFCQTCTVYKVGFVGRNGEFADGFEIEFSCYKFNDQKLVLFLNTGKTPAERAAQDRAHERTKERKRKEAEIESKRCSIETEEWKREMLSKYQ